MRSLGPLICVLGLGEAGQLHARSLLATGARVGVASRRGSVPAYADVFYEDYEAPLRDPAVQGVVIATPYATHPCLVRAAASAGKHVLCEKPLGASLGDALTARDAARDVRTMTGFMRRWDEGYRRARLAVDGGVLGAPLTLKCTSGDAEYPEKYRREASPGAMFLDLAVHDIDLARWLLCDEVESVYARAGALVHPEIGAMGDADTACAMLNMCGGSTAMLTLSRALAYGHNVTTELVGSEASVQIGELKRTELVTYKKGTVGTDVCSDFRERFKEAFDAQMAAFVRLVSADEEEAAELLRDPSYASYDDGIAATQVAEALVASARSACVVQVASV